MNKSNRTREQWLEAAIKILTEKLFKPLGHKVPKVRISVGFPSNRGAAKMLGSHWSPEASTDKVGQIFIAPQTDDSLRILGVLVHELVHASVGNKAGHGPEFRKVAEALGLTGKMRSTTETPELQKRLNALVIKKLGKIPHAALNAAMNPKKKQTTRLLKASCPETDYTVRITKKWLDMLGAPVCPCCELPMNVEGSGEETEAA